MTPVAPLHPMYLEDDYPRYGCRVEIVVPDKDHAGERRWGARIYAPGTDKRPPLESYLCSSAENAAWVASLLMKGEPVPRFYHTMGNGDQSG